MANIRVASIPTDWNRAHGTITSMLRNFSYWLDRASRDYWEALQIPAGSINLSGSATPPTVDTTTVPGSLLFSTSSTNAIAGCVQVPHGWKEGSNIYPHIHWTKTTADGSGLAVAWEMKYAVASIGEAIPAYSAWLSHTLESGDLTTLEKHNLSSFTAINMAAETVGVYIFWQLQRDVTDDTYGSNARLLGIDFHYERNTGGSEIEYDKL